MLRVLIADDAFYSGRVKDLLEQEGYQVMLEPRITGDRVLELVLNSEDRPDILILEIVLPPGPKLAAELEKEEHDLPGFKIIQEIRKTKGFELFPIICLTGYSGDDAVLDVLAGMGCYILKKAYVRDNEEILRTVEFAAKDIP